MAFVTPQEGEVRMLQSICGYASEQLTLKLYSNNYTPVEASTGASFTECTGSSYAAISLTNTSFTITGADPSTLAYALQTFTLSGALTAYGYYVVGTTSAKVYFAELFSGGPYVTPSGGGTIKVTLNATM